MKLLIVDDSKFSQIVTSNLLRNLFDDIEIILANDGEEGFKKYEENKPEYVILDLLMPKLNGKELIKMIKEYDEDAKLFVVSADVQKNVREEIESYEIMGFINKPFNEEKAKFVYDTIKGDIDER